MNNPEPNAVLAEQEERVRAAIRHVMQCRLSSINQQKAALEKESESIREYLRLTRANGA